MSRRASLALTALAAIVAVTAAWWALALWPASPSVPAWVERTRAACFGGAASGMPHAGGWILLIGEPIGMLGFLLIVWGDAVGEGLSALWRSRSGRVALAGAVTLVSVGFAGTGVRVRTLVDASAAWRVDSGQETPGVAQRMAVAAPPLALLNHRGERIQLAELRGRVVLVTFAYGHCATVCPIMVHEAVRAVTQLPDLDPLLLVVTLDPWRDTPSRLPHIAQSWSLPEGAHLLGGSVADVEAALDAWKIERRRDERTGEIVHPTSVYIVDRDGRLAWIAPADGGRLAALAGAL